MRPPCPERTPRTLTGPRERRSPRRTWLASWPGHRSGSRLGTANRTPRQSCWHTCRWGRLHRALAPVVSASLLRRQKGRTTAVGTACREGKRRSIRRQQARTSRCCRIWARRSPPGKTCRRGSSGKSELRPGRTSLRGTAQARRSRPGTRTRRGMPDRWRCQLQQCRSLAHTLYTCRFQAGRQSQVDTRKVPLRTMLRSRDLQGKERSWRFPRSQHTSQLRTKSKQTTTWRCKAAAVSPPDS